MMPPFKRHHFLRRESAGLLTKINLRRLWPEKAQSRIPNLYLIVLEALPRPSSAKCDNE